MDILAGLNPAQREAVQTIQGPLLIIAGPGSGKTKVIAHRIAYLLKVANINPRQIMAVTFTNKAAGEMRERVYNLLGQVVEELTLGTFHAICARILRRDGERIGINNKFVIYDDEDQISLIKQCLEKLDLDPRRYSPKVVQSAIKAAKSRLISPKEYIKRATQYYEEMLYRVYECYDNLLLQNQGLDFDDLIMKAVILFRECPDVLEKYQSRYLYILVDEFQDTNLAQYELLKLLSRKHHNICVVGDPDQSIYSWRYADLRHILTFERDFPDAKVIYLEQSYRSTKTILELASYIIASNPNRKPIKLWTENEKGIPVSIIETYNEQEEAQFVASEIERLLKQGLPLKECAVMYRTNAQSRILEETFLRYGIPYKLVGALRFYQRKEIKDIIAYLRLIHNTSDNISLSRVINIPNRGIGKRTIAELSRWAEVLSVPLFEAIKLLREIEGPPFNPRIKNALLDFFNLIVELKAKAQESNLVELLDYLIERTGYKEYILSQSDGEERWENILELRSIAQEYNEKGLEGFLDGVSLISDVDNLDEKVEAVTLITLHQAKGLEFGAVFIVGMEEGVFPHYKSFADPEEMEEERRLCYVGITRAKKYLYLIYSLHRTSGGITSPCLPSRFLKDIPPNLAISYSLGEREAKFVPLKPGDQVRHSLFGEGVVLSAISLRGDQELTIAFKKVGIKKLILSLSPLERIG